MAESLIAARFRVEREVAEGGMGRILRALDEQTGTTVALKQLLRTDDVAAHARFARECQLLEKIHHPLVVRHVAHELRDDEPWLAMEWLDGEELGSRLSRGPLDLTTALRVMDDLVEAVEHLHSVGVVHRDLKPSNAMLVEEGGRVRAKLIDLGIARDTAPDATAVTRTGGFVGTPLYVSPEQASGGYVDARSDVWSLGAILFEMVSGSSPFHANSALAVLSKILMGHIPRLARTMVGIPEWLDAVVARALERDPKQRFGGASELRQALGATQGVMRPSTPPRVVAEERRTVLALLYASASESSLVESRRLLAEQGVETTPVRGGFLLARFGFTRASPEDPIRCANLALRLRGVDPGARIAFALARATGGSENEVYERCAALLLQTEPGEVVSDDDTLGLFGERAITVIRETARVVIDLQESGASSTFDGPSLMGREAELGRLEGLWRSVVEESRPAGAILIGEPGLGKTKLAAAFVDRVRAISPTAQVVRWTGDALAAETAFAMIGAAFYRDAGLVSTSDPSEQRARLARWAARELGSTAQARLPFVSRMVGLEPATSDGDRWRLAGEDQALMRAEFEGVWDAWLRQRHGPTLVLIEDAHWGDPASLSLAARAVGLESVPVLIVATTRPTVVSGETQLLEGLAEQIVLKPLSPRAAARLADALLGEAVDNETARVVLARAGGHPLFLRELARAARKDAAHLPLSIEFLVQQRLDALPPTALEACRVASVCGEVAWGGALEAVLGRPCKADVAALVAEDILVRRTSSAVPEETELAFRHALLRDATYGTVSEPEARRYHARIGRWLEEHARPRRPAILAHHAERAAELSTAAFLYAEAMVESARLAQLQEAAQLCCRALDLGVQAHVEPSRVGAWLTRLAELLFVVRFIHEAIGTATRAAEVLEHTGDPSARFHARLARASILASAGLLDDADAAFSAMAQEPVQDPQRLAALLLARGSLAQRQGNFRAAKALLTRVESEHLPPERRFELHVVRLTALAGAGDHAGAEAELAVARQSARGDAIATARVAKQEALMHYFAGRIEPGIEVSRHACELSHEAGLLYEEAVTLHNVADLTLEAGRATEARSLLVDALGLARKGRFETLMKNNEALLAIVDFILGEGHETDLVEKTLRWFQSRAEIWALVALELQFARALALRGAFDAAGRHAEHSRDFSDRWGFEPGVEKANRVQALVELGGRAWRRSDSGAHRPVSVEDYRAKVRCGERPSAEEALAYLEWWHLWHPGADWIVEGRRLPDGRTSYDLLASCVSQGATGVFVDLACGDGVLTKILAERLAPDATIVGLDVCDAELATARSRVPNANVTFRRELAACMSFANASVDILLCHWALMLFTPLDAVVAEIARVVAPGGTFATAIPGPANFASISPALQDLVDEVRKRDLPAFPDLGLGDPGLAERGPAAFFNATTGFADPVSVSAHTLTVRWDVSMFVASLRCLYWFDLLQDDAQERLLVGARRLLAGGTGVVEMHTPVTLIVARRA